MQRARRTPDTSRRAFVAPAAGASEPDANDDAAFDLSDVPAAVVCATCGKPDCAGCLPSDESTHASGVVAIVPWERPGQSVLSRLWATARLATLSHRELFSGMPEGGLAAPLAFALLAESLAAIGLGLCAAGALSLAPDFIGVVLGDPVLRSVLFRAFGYGLPGVVVLMVVLHALHGVVVDRAARWAGSQRRGRGLRFGLYACGWDLVTLPPGLLLVLLTEGVGAARLAAGAALSVPSAATRAYLAGIHHLDPERAKRATRRASLTIVGWMFTLLFLGGVLFFLAR
jgi:hypothetical protein